MANKLTKEQFLTLWRRYRATGDKGIRRVLIEAHLELVRVIAQGFLKQWGRYLELDDLISWGVFGLVDALDGFREDNGVRFTTFAGWRIRGSILDELRNADWAPRLVRRHHKLYERAAFAIRARTGDARPTIEEVAEELKLSVPEAGRIVADARVVQMEMVPFDPDGEPQRVYFEDVSEEDGEAPEVRAAQSLDFERLLEGLSAANRLIFTLYYREGLTLCEIGELIGLTESRICQLHGDALKKLRRMVRGSKHL